MDIKNDITYRQAIDFFAGFKSVEQFIDRVHAAPTRIEVAVLIAEMVLAVRKIAAVMAATRALLIGLVLGFILARLIP